MSTPNVPQVQREGFKATDVVRMLHKAAESWGYPASSLADNGLIFLPSAAIRWPGDRTGALRPRHRGQALAALPSPDLGKSRALPPDAQEVLGRQEGIETKKQLQRAIDRFVVCYNPVRPHCGIARRTPLSAYGAREKVTPSPSFVKIGHRRLRLDRIDRSRRVTLRRAGRFHHIGIGNAHAGWRVALLIDDLDIEIVGLDGSPLRRLTLDPTKDYQRIP